jgi:hypothetical protein
MGSTDRLNHGVHWWEAMYLDIVKVHCNMRWQVGVLDQSGFSSIANDKTLNCKRRESLEVE